MYQGFSVAPMGLRQACLLPQELRSASPHYRVSDGNSRRQGETFPSSKDLILNTKPVEKESTQQAIERIEAIDVIRVIPADYDVFAEE